MRKATLDGGSFYNVMPSFPSAVVAISLEQQKLKTEQERLCFCVHDLMLGLSGHPSRSWHLI